MSPGPALFCYCKNKTAAVEIRAVMTACTYLQLNGSDSAIVACMRSLVLLVVAAGKDVCAKVSFVLKNKGSVCPLGA